MIPIEKQSSPAMGTELGETDLFTGFRDLTQAVQIDIPEMPVGQVGTLVIKNQFFKSLCSIAPDRRHDLDRDRENPAMRFVWMPDVKDTEFRTFDVLLHNRIHLATLYLPLKLTGVMHDRDTSATFSHIRFHHQRKTRHPSGDQ